jgi:hypothetical protein
MHALAALRRSFAVIGLPSVSGGRSRSPTVVCQSSSFAQSRAPLPVVAAPGSVAICADASHLPLTGSHPSPFSGVESSTRDHTHSLSQSKAEGAVTLERALSGAAARRSVDSVVGRCHRFAKSCGSLRWASDQVVADGLETAAPTAVAVGAASVLPGVFDGVSGGASAPPPSMRLEANRVTLPAVAGRVRLCAVLPAATALQYASVTPTAWRRVAGTPPRPIQPPRPAFLVAPGEWVPFIRRLFVAGMVDFTTKPHSVCGVFAVAKPPDAQRFIVDARPANWHLAAPAAVTLPTPDKLAAIRMPYGQFTPRRATSKFTIRCRHHSG